MAIFKSEPETSCCGESPDCIIDTEDMVSGFELGGSDHSISFDFLVWSEIIRPTSNTIPIA